VKIMRDAPPFYWGAEFGTAWVLALRLYGVTKLPSPVSQVGQPRLNHARQVVASNWRNKVIWDDEFIALFRATVARCQPQARSTRDLDELVACRLGMKYGAVRVGRYRYCNPAQQCVVVLPMPSRAARPPAPLQVS
jgi:hypothetical protein